MIDAGLGYASPPGDVTTIDQINAEIADLQSQIDGITGGPTNFLLSSAGDVEIPGPNPPMRGAGVLVPDGSGHFRLIPRVVFLTDALFFAWQAAADDDAPLAIVNTSMPSGTVNQVYTSTTFTAAHGMPVYKWSVSSNGDALPNGVTLTDNGNGTATVAGTPLTGSDKTYNVIIEVVDGLGTKLDQLFTFIIAGVGAPMGFTVPLLPAGAVGSAYPSTSVAGGVTNATGAVTFYAYAASPYSASSDVTAHTIHATGIGGLVAGTAVAFRNLGATTGLSVDTRYWVVNPNSGADTIQVSATLGGAAIAIGGANATGITVYKMTLPNHKVQLATNGTLSSSANFAAADAGFVNFAITAFDSGGHAVTATASINVKNIGVGPTITRTSVPAGRVGTAYTSTTFTATDTDAGAVLAWSLNTTSGDALPTGMTLSAAGALAGTPGTGTDKTYNLIVRVTDTSTGNVGSGLYAEQAITLTIAAAVAPMTAPIPNAATGLDVATVGVDYTYSVADQVSNAQGTLAFDSFDDSKQKVSWVLDSTANVMKKVGGTAPTAGTRVSFAGITGTGAVASGAANSYVVVNPGTTGGVPSFQVASTTAPTTALSLAGLTGATVTVNFPTLPNHALDINLTTGIIAGSGASLTTGTITFRVGIYDGTTRLNPQTSITIGGGLPAGASINLALISGITLGTLASTAANRALAKKNTDLVNTAIESMRSNVGGQGYIYYDASTVTGTPTRITYSQSGGKYLHSEGSGGGLNKWYVSNVEFFVMDDEPMHSSPYGNNQFDFINIQNATAPELQVWCNGNGANQKQFSAARTGAELGMQMNGMEIQGCGKIKWGKGDMTSASWWSNSHIPCKFYNFRSVTGSTNAGANVAPDATAAAVHYGAIECFSVHQGHCKGGAKGWIDVQTTDGLSHDPTAYLVGGAGHVRLDTRCSGFTIEQTVHDSANVFTRHQYLVTANNMRHGTGVFGGGVIQWMPGSIFDTCEHGINCETGDPAHTDTEYTRQCIVGLDDGTAAAGDIITRNCTAIGIQYNGNGGSGHGIAQMDVYGWDSTNDAVAFSGTGNAPDQSVGSYNGKITIHSAVLHAPGYCDNLSSSVAAHTILTGTCKYNTVGHRVHQSSTPVTGAWAQAAF